MLLLLIILLLLSAIFSGLTIGMFSLSPSSLERKIKKGDKNAAKVLKVRKEGNFLLCTLLLSNTAINSSIAVILGNTISGIYAGIISAILIFTFAELLPQATFSRHALLIGGKTAWLVKIFMYLMWPIAKPVSILLDKIFGKELPDLFDKQELSMLLEEHVGESLDADENRILKGAMHFSDKTAYDVCTPITVVFRLEEEVELNQEVLELIKKEHYSRIPVYSKTRDNIVGILYAKDLISYNNQQKLKVKNVCRIDTLLFVDENIKLDILLNKLIDKKTHLAFVYDNYGVLKGLTSLEDIIEEILKTEILDEEDTVADLQHYAKQQHRKNLKK
jgi:metal transporter CNNM